MNGQHMDKRKMSAERNASALAFRRHTQRGQILVESALTLLPFLFLIIGIIDTSLAIWVRSTMEHAVREGARYAITYQTETGLQHDASIKQIVVRNGMGLLRTSDITIEYFDGNVGGTGFLTAYPANAGNSPDNIVVVSARRNWFWIARNIMSASAPSLSLRAASADRMEALGAGSIPPVR